MKKKLYFLLSAIFAALFLGIFTHSTSVSALSIEEKSVYEGLVTCYKSGGFKSPLKIEEFSFSSSDYYKELSIINSTGESKKLPLINGFYSDDEASCRGILIGNEAGWNSKNLFGGLQRIEGLNPPDASNYGSDNTGYITAVKDFMGAMGYKAGTTQEEINSTTKCFNLPYDEEFINYEPALGQDPILHMGEKYTNYACYVFDKNNKLSKTETADAPADNSFDMAWFDAVEGSGNEGIYVLGMKFSAKNCSLNGSWFCSTNTFTWSYAKDTYDIDELKDDWYQTVTTKNEYGGWQYAAAYSYMSVYYPGPPQSRQDVVDKSDITTEFTLDSSAPLYGEGIMGNIAEYDSEINGLKFSVDEKVLLYQHYLKNVYKVEIKGCYSDPNNISYQSTGKQYRLTDSKGTEFTCIVTPASSPNKEVNGLNSEDHFKDTKLKFDDILSALDGLTVSYEITEGESPDTSAAKSGVSEKCLNNSAAESLSWVVCPTIDGMAEGSDGVYSWIKDQLKVDATMISNGIDTPAYKIWGFFRDIANVIFIIMILIVIVSQVTGYGIDNYGIKKMLPRLIVTGILINVSYFICQFSVDISNVIGSNLNLWLSSIAESSTDANLGVSITSVVEAILGGGGAVVGAGGTFMIAAFKVAAGWWLVLIIIIIVLLIIVIAVVVVCLMLAARQLIVIVAVAIAPLAIICYALPNTEKLYKRWFDIFKAALVMFPICSALAGMGQIVQAIVYGTQNPDGLHFSMALIAAACPFIPFFVLPTLLKGALKAVGDLGGKISGLGSKVHGAASRTMSSARNTDAYHERQFQNAMSRNTRRLNRFKNADGTWKDDSKLTAGQRRRKNLYQRRDLAFQKDNAERRNMASGGYESALAKQESDYNKQAVENEIAQMANETGNYDADIMNDKLKELLGKDSLTDAEELRMKALMQKMAGGSGYGKKLLAKTAAGASEGTSKSVAKFMSKNGDVSAAINGKDLGAGQYLREVNSGATTKSYEDWKKETRTVDGKTMSNAQFVMSKVATDDNDVVGQSASAVSEMLKSKEADGSYTFSNDRLRVMVNNERLMDSADSDVRSALIEEAKARNIALPERFGGAAATPTPTPTPAPAGPAPQPSGTPIDPTTLNIDHDTATRPQQTTTPPRRIITGAEADAAFNQGRRDGSIILPGDNPNNGPHRA